VKGSSIIRNNKKKVVEYELSVDYLLNVGHSCFIRKCMSEINISRVIGLYMIDSGHKSTIDSVPFILGTVTHLHRRSALYRTSLHLQFVSLNLKRMLPSSKRWDWQRSAKKSMANARTPQIQFSLQNGAKSRYR
jgi:hypothetical protein